MDGEDIDDDYDEDYDEDEDDLDDEADYYEDEPVDYVYDRVSINELPKPWRNEIERELTGDENASGLSKSQMLVFTMILVGSAVIFMFAYKRYNYANRISNGRTSLYFVAPIIPKVSRFFYLAQRVHAVLPTTVKQQKSQLNSNNKSGASTPKTSYQPASPHIVVDCMQSDARAED